MEVIKSVTTTTAEVREYLTAARTYYVREDGNDTNNGLTNTSGGAFLTIQRAVDVVCTTLDVNSQAVTIQVADGDFNAQVNLKDYVGIGPVTVQGNTTTPTNVRISTTASHAFVASSGSWTVRGFKVATTGANYDGINGSGLARVNFASMNFGACGRYHVTGLSGATLVGSGAYTISGNAYGHLGAGAMCRIALASATVTVSGTPAFTAFALATFGGVMEFYDSTFSGAATGKRYDLSRNGVIFTGGGGANYFPGDSAGTAVTGGQYD